MLRREKYNEAALRAVALFEMAKGLLVLLIGFGLLTLVGKDVGDAAENLVRMLHLNPERALPSVFIRLADRFSDKTLWVAALGAFIYTAVRFIEAYGLWRTRVWAEWFALLSGLLYVPWEIFELVTHPNPVKWSIFILNVVVVLYMAYLRASDRGRPEVQT